MKNARGEGVAARIRREIASVRGRIEATYRVRSDARSIAARAQAIAIEQSVETPVEAIEDERVKAEIVGRV